ncbi:IS1096 element passenger TnpR family protein [Dactylosporangium sp. CA-233914]|uniref:IS1096 element passenger TnpR family protein n=1 Tax=Dactylosporangium sp. CA-233914 TaxID=3239934 RepID=UPI003D8D04D7
MPTMHSVPGPRATVYQMAYFPPAEYEAAWSHGLLNATSYRRHADYRRETEQALRAMAERGGSGIRVVALDVPDLLAYAQRRGKDPAHRQTRLAYTGWLHETGRAAIDWPPERNGPCWCGSGGKYKKCCGSPAFLGVEPPDPASLILTIELDGVTPRVWRRVAIPSNTPLDRVHLMIQDAMGWQDNHMYVFETDEFTVIDPRSDSDEIPADGKRLVSIAGDRGARFAYVYDFGDAWGHTVTVDEIRPGGPDNVFTVLDGGGACPPEDVGGVAGYQQLLAAYADPASPDHDDAVDILGPDFDPAALRSGEAERAVSGHAAL